MPDAPVLNAPDFGAPVLGVPVLDAPVLGAHAAGTHIARLTLDSDGEISSAKPATFLELWNTVFAATGLLWVFLVSAGLLLFYLTHLPPSPSFESMAPAQAKDALEVHKQVYEQYRQTLTDVFDLLVTRTMLPIVTLLLGYLFGKTSNNQ